MNIVHRDLVLAIEGIQVPIFDTTFDPVELFGFRPPKTSLLMCPYLDVICKQEDGYHYGILARLVSFIDNGVSTPVPIFHYRVFEELKDLPNAIIFQALKEINTDPYQPHRFEAWYLSEFSKIKLRIHCPDHNASGYTGIVRDFHFVGELVCN